MTAIKTGRAARRETSTAAVIRDSPAVDWTSVDTPVAHEGTRIVLPGTPGPMDYDSAIQTLERVKQQEEQTFDTVEIVKGAPWDALVATYKAMQSIYGVVMAQSLRTFFGEIRPDMVTVVTGPGDADRVQVPAGRMALPNVSEPIQIGMLPQGVYIKGVVRKRDRAILVEIATRARQIMSEDSVYRGRAIRLGVDDDGDLNMEQQPEFLNLSGVQEADMIHTDETAAQIRVSMLSPLKNTDACRRHRIPLKRGILLEGKYGTGKSLTARVIAKVATENRWTFIMLDRVQGLKTAIEFARAYQPAVIFAEDIDRAADREDESVNDLVNMLDGILTKDVEIMTVLTTNFVEKIDRALLRPGRFDAVISIQSPDGVTAQRLIRAYARDLLGTDDLTPVGEAIQGWIPATIREVVERAKLAMLSEDRAEITADDLMVAAMGMRRHMELLNPVEQVKTAKDLFAEGLTGLIAQALDPDTVDGTSNDEIAELVKQGNSLGMLNRKRLGETLQAAQAAGAAAETGRKLSKEILEHVA